MSKTLNVRVPDELGEFIDANVGEVGLYDNASEYIRDLIRRDKERAEAIAFERLKGELQRAFAAPDNDFVEIDRDAMLARIRSRRG
jgi:antitoxin ParD1/3/4